ncbi:MAG: tetratricopeptide repeat protein, partial [candidate division Zixibacteria bacterium]|nr:tetratricopeptide repeat protein [candidate division Zixibacteria bacterium]
MMRNKTSIVLVLVSLVLAGCSQSLYMQGRRHLQNERYDPAIESFYQEISANPTNHEAWRELGVAYYEKGDLTKSEEALKQASNIKPDARTQLYLGLVYERRELYENAIDAYTASLSLGSKGRTAEITRDHLRRLVRKNQEVEIARALENEADIDAATIPDNTIAVPSFDGSHLPPELAPIALGLSEFTAIDLAKVRSLTVVERAKLAILLDELKLGRSGYVDPATAPRVGRIMKSRRIVTASVLALGDEGLRLDGSVVSTTDSAAVIPEGVEGKLEDIFALQKRFVFNILDSLGITLTVDERDAIAKVPTESYLAFLAYCRGLDYRQRGMENAARAEFGKAVELDAGFGVADAELKRDAGFTSGGLSHEQSFES